MPGKRTVGILFVALALCGQAWAGALEDASAAYQRGDYATAVRLWHQLALQGNAEAQDKVGIMYSTGLGVPQDYVQAMKWYRLAADQGYVSSLEALGNMYFIGEGVPKDFGEAAKWYRRAADRGSAASQYMLGANYKNGWGVPKDYVLAHMWLNLAAAQGDFAAAAKERDAVAAVMTPAQIAEAQKLAREWKPK